MIRVRIADLDFAAKTVIIREKKRVRAQITTRRVPLSAFLVSVLKEWLAVHPGGGFLFSQQPVVARSKKRSPTTGHPSQKTRPTTGDERRKNVKARTESSGVQVTPDEAHDHFQRTLAASDWHHVHGWHCLRHSFISACASKGVQDMMLQSWAGHMSPKMLKRYAHLYPSTQQEALSRVFE